MPVTVKEFRERSSSLPASLPPGTCNLSISDCVRTCSRMELCAGIAKHRFPLSSPVLVLPCLANPVSHPLRLSKAICLCVMHFLCFQELRSAGACISRRIHQMAFSGWRFLLSHGLLGDFLPNAFQAQCRTSVMDSLQRWLMGCVKW